MSYSSVDPVIAAWIQNHALGLYDKWGGDIRAVYVSSKAGECFQIWIEMPQHNRVSIHAAFLDGPDEEKEKCIKDWNIEISQLNKALEEAFETVLNWMKPSVRHIPDKS